MKTPKIIVCSGLKGGIGKSTVAINLAVEFVRKYPVSILDLDYQKSVTIFNRVRAAADLPTLNVINADTVKDFQKISKNNKGLLIIDAGAFDSDLNRAALKAADMVITPVSDSEVEIYGLIIFNKILSTLKDVKAHVLLNRVGVRASNIKEVISQVEQHNKTLSLFASRLADRADYRKTFITGQGVTEMKATAPASKEIKALIKEVEKCLK